MTATVLYVCTGNIHRSAMAQVMFCALADPEAAIAVSAGTAAVRGHGMARESRQAMIERGLDGSTHRARQLTAVIAAGADLILTAETRHRDLVVAEQPRLMRRVFTMIEFVRLGESAGPLSGDLTARVAAVAARRGKVAAPTVPEDIADPVGRGLDDVRRCAAEISATVHATVTLLGLDRP